MQNELIRCFIFGKWNINQQAELDRESTGRIKDPRRVYRKRPQR